MQILIVIHMPKVFRTFNIPPCVSLDPPDLMSGQMRNRKKKKSQATPETKEWIIIVRTTDPVPQRETKENSEVLAAANSLDAILRQGLMIWMTDLCPNDYIDDLQGYNIYMFLKSSSYS